MKRISLVVTTIAVLLGAFLPASASASTLQDFHVLQGKIGNSYFIGYSAQAEFGYDGQLFLGITVLDKHRKVLWPKPCANANEACQTASRKAQVWSTFTGSDEMQPIGQRLRVPRSIWSKGRYIHIQQDLLGPAAHSWGLGVAKTRKLQRHPGSYSD